MSDSDDEILPTVDGFQGPSVLDSLGRTSPTGSVSAKGCRRRSPNTSAVPSTALPDGSRAYRNEGPDQKFYVRLLHKYPTATLDREGDGKFEFEEGYVPEKKRSELAVLRRQEDRQQYAFPSFLAASDPFVKSYLRNAKDDEPISGGQPVYLEWDEHSGFKVRVCTARARARGA